MLFSNHQGPPAQSKDEIEESTCNDVESLGGEVEENKIEVTSILKQHELKGRNRSEPKHTVLGIPAIKEEPLDGRNSKRKSKINGQLACFILAGVSIIIGLSYTLDDKKAERFLTNVLKRLNGKHDIVT